MYFRGIMKEAFLYNDEQAALTYLKEHVKDIYGENGGVVVRFDPDLDLLWVMKYYAEEDATDSTYMSVNFLASAIDATGTTNYGLYITERTDRKDSDLTALAHETLARFIMKTKR